MTDPSCDGVLDPASPDPELRRLVLAWLRVQRAFVYHPEQCANALRRGVAPMALLDATSEASAAGRAEHDRAVLARLGANLVPLDAVAYPERLRRLDDAPPLLVVRGDPRVLSALAVAIVGPRAPTAYGRASAARLARGAAEAGVVVVSGLALGVDGAAHGAALDVGAPTVAFQGCGPERIYPAAHRALAARIEACGAIVSEFPVGTKPLAHHFPLRNRLISALARLVVVVEARERSGSLVTARHAANQSVDVGAVPGPIDAPTSRATNRLLREGARVIASEADLLCELGLDVGVTPPPRSVPATTPEQRALLSLLGDGPRSRDELARASGLGTHASAVALVELELAGRVVEERDGRLRRTS